MWHQGILCVHPGGYLVHTGLIRHDIGLVLGHSIVEFNNIELVPLLNVKPVLVVSRCKDHLNPDVFWRKVT